jgi:hypothetical protein
MRGRRYVPNLFDYDDDDLERTDNYHSLWCEHCQAYSAWSCLCWKRNPSSEDSEEKDGGCK